MTDTADIAGAAIPADPALSAWEDAPRIDRADAAPILAVDGFEGPLDWWLEMARAQKIDVSKLSIAVLIGTFATALEAALATRRDGQLARWAGWTVMAASLTELWSRLLLPADEPAARGAVEEAETLRRQLLERARMRQAADWLERRTQLGRDVFRSFQPAVSAAGRGGALTELLRACLPVLCVPREQEAALRPRPPPLWTASDAIRQITQRLAALPTGSPLAAFLPSIDGGAPQRGLRCRAAVASTLLGVLELARNGVLALEQDADWQPIRVSSRANGVPAPADPAPPA